MEWIISNLGTIVVALVVLTLLTFLVVYMIIRKKQGKSSCSCGCSSCPNAQICHTKTKQNDSSSQN